MIHGCQDVPFQVQDLLRQSIAIELQEHPVTTEKRLPVIFNPLETGGGPDSRVLVPELRQKKPKTDRLFLIPFPRKNRIQETNRRRYLPHSGKAAGHDPDNLAGVAVFGVEAAKIAEDLERPAVISRTVEMIARIQEDVLRQTIKIRPPLESMAVPDIGILGEPHAVIRIGQRKNGRSGQGAIGILGVKPLQDFHGLGILPAQAMKVSYLIESFLRQWGRRILFQQVLIRINGIPIEGHVLVQVSQTPVGEVVTVADIGIT